MNGLRTELSADQLTARCARVRFLLLDVDGVLTDGRLLHDGSSVTKSFHARDGLGLKLAMRAGLGVGLLTARADAAVTVRAGELGIEDVLAGRSDKATAFGELLGAKGLSAEAVAYIGDDLPDLPAIRLAGLSFAPADAAPEVAQAVDVVLTTAGGQGVAREMAELILKSRGSWDGLVASY